MSKLQADADGQLIRFPMMDATVRSSPAQPGPKVDQGAAPQEIQQQWFTQVALEESLDRYRDLFESAPVGYLTLTFDGLIVEINHTGTEFLLGKECKATLHRRLARFVTPEYREKYYRTLSQVKTTGHRHSCTVALKRCDTSIFYAQLGCIQGAACQAQPTLRITVTDVTEHKRAELEVEKLAFYDSLTNLPNRRLLLDRLHHAKAVCSRTQQFGAILFIDLDNFKSVNDTHGHDAGDCLLQQAAHRLTACVRASDSVSRLGGDEFVVMLEGLSTDLVEASEQAKSVGEKILAQLSMEYCLKAREHRSTGSVGATLFNKNRDSVEDLLKRADLALYRAKAAGGNALRFFESETWTT